MRSRSKSPLPQKKIKERIPLPYIINYRCRDRQCAIVPSPHPPSTFQEKRFFPDWFQRFRRVSAVNFIPCSLCRGRDTDPCINEKKGRRREEYGSTWLFRARSDRSSPEFPTNSAPAARVSVGGGKKGRKRDRKNSLKRVLISYLPETGLSLRSCRDASDDLPASRDGWGDRVVNSPPIFAK